MQTGQIKRLKDGNRFAELTQAAADPNGAVRVAGITDSRSALIAGLIADATEHPSLILTPTWTGARRLADDLRFLSDRPIFLMPESDSTLFVYEARSREDLTARLRGLAALSRSAAAIVVADFAEAARPLPPRAELLSNRVWLKDGFQIKPEFLREKLRRLGYERVTAVEGPGQYSSRGEVFDIFTPDREEPVRVEFFDIEVDSLRSFDPISQRSTGRLAEVEIFPAETLILDETALAEGLARLKAAYLSPAPGLSQTAKENLAEIYGRIAEAVESGVNLQLPAAYNAWFYPTPARLWDYLPTEGRLIIDDPTRLTNLLAAHQEEATERWAERLEKGLAVPAEADQRIMPDLLKKIQPRDRLFWLTPSPELPEGLKADRALTIESTRTPVLSGRMDFLETELKRYGQKDYDITLVASTEARAANLTDFAERLGLVGTPRVCVGNLSEGILFPAEKWLMIPDHDIFQTAKRRKTQRVSDKPTIEAFIDLKPNDYVVHDSHGVGRFVGTVQMEVQGVRREYLKLTYAGSDVLYVPVEQMDLVQKYTSAESAMPRLSRLGGSEWRRTRDRVKSAIKDMAKELLAVSASRQIEPGFAFAADSVWQREFEDQFPYEETPDQRRSVREIKRDMESPKAMDRLLCGDVGYGKTEVAARAIFKCVTSGRQAAVLVPTTLLANQHLHMFTERFKGFPISVSMVSRFRTGREQTEILKQVKAGAVDILIGTHRLFSSDVQFKDLGLLVIDEEQHFGVQHKEAIKQLRRNVDVLTLSATPIPRTLHLSLSGIRDISLLTEPPEERYPVRTYVMEQDDAVMSEAIVRELARGGQVYMIYNRVRGIQQVAAKIRELAPNASVAVAHGQLAEDHLETVMADFEANRHQVLVATTIVESGIDIPNVNTIFILNADHFGLGQLYQLRGRVGRSDRLAYAYLMYQKHKLLSEVAEKRLKAIREFTEFGAGFHIAMRDLEIRGAGNLLGAEQHGHMMTIGYELYCRLVDEAVRELAGESLPTLTTEASINLDVAGYIPDEYIEDGIQRLQMYKRIAGIRSEADRLDVVDELLDRYGDLPNETMNLTQIALLRALAEQAGVSEVNRQQQHLMLWLDSHRRFDPARLAGLADVYGARLLIHGGQRPYIKLNLLREKPLAAALGILTKMAE